jgi:hypothetical protein
MLYTHDAFSALSIIAAAAINSASISVDNAH